MRQALLLGGLVLGLLFATAVGADEAETGPEASAAAPEIVGTLPGELTLGPTPLQPLEPSAKTAAIRATKTDTSDAPEATSATEAETQFLPCLLPVFAPHPGKEYRERVLAATRLTEADLQALQKAADPLAALAASLGLEAGAAGTDLPQRQLLRELLTKLQAARVLVSFDQRNQPQAGVSLGNDALLRRELQRNWQGVSGFVRDEKGEPWAGLELELHEPGGREPLKTQTSVSGYYEFTATATEGVLHCGKQEFAAQWGEGQRQFVNLTVPRPRQPTRSGASDEAAMALPGEGMDTSGIVNTFADLGALPSPLTSALQLLTRRMPVMGGVTWSSRSGLRAYYGLEQTLGGSRYDRASRLAAFGDLIVEIVEYAPQWGVPTLGAERMTEAVAQARQIRKEAQQDEAAVQYLMTFARTKRQEIVEQGEPTEAGVGQVTEYTDQISALNVKLPYLQLRRRAAQAQEGYYEALAQRATAEAVDVFEQTSTLLEQRRQAFDQAKTMLETARETGGGGDNFPALSEPDAATVDTAAGQAPTALLGNASVRTLRLTVAAQLDPTALDFAQRRLPGNYGLTIGLSLGSDGSSSGAEAAYGAWYRLGKRFDLKLMAGRTVDSSGYEAETLGGLMFNLPLGQTSD